MKFLSLVKPGIIFGNVVTVFGGFFMASRGHVNWGLLLAAVVGMAFIIACGCVLNNVIDHDIDGLMERTKKRVMPNQLVHPKVAVVYGVGLGILGFAFLYFFTNLLTVLVAAAGLFFYVVAYTLWTKRSSPAGTLVGGISGAVPPVAGYCAVSNHFDAGAWILFAILFFWQMPHFYAIAIFRLKDYQNAKIPVLPAVRGIEMTKVHMMLYILPFTAAALLPSVFGYTGLVYFGVVFIMGSLWFILAATGIYTQDDVKWAKRMFAASILIITLISVLMGLNPLLF